MTKIDIVVARDENIPGRKDALRYLEEIGLTSQSVIRLSPDTINTLSTDDLYKMLRGKIVCVPTVGGSPIGVTEEFLRVCEYLIGIPLNILKDDYPANVVLLVLRQLRRIPDKDKLKIIKQRYVKRTAD